jgi:hypothetical protein
MAAQPAKTPVQKEEEAKPTSRVTATVVQLLIWGRVVLGGLSYVTPALMAKLVLVPGVSATSLAAYPVQLFGVRELILSGLLWTERAPFNGAPMDSRHRRAVQKMLVANVITDSLDLLATAGAFYMGLFPRPAGLLMCSGAVTFISVGLLGLATV